MHSAVHAITRPGSVGAQSQGQAWRRHLRRHVPAPAVIPPFARQRVHNVYHHVADLSLPCDLWNEEAELAAIVHLLGRHEKGTAARIYVETVRFYLEYCRRFDSAVPKFCERDSYAKVWQVATVREQLPVGSSDADVYAAVLNAFRKERNDEYPPIAV